MARTIPVYRWHKYCRMNQITIPEPASELEPSDSEFSLNIVSVAESARFDSCSIPSTSTFTSLLNSENNDGYDDMMPADLDDLRVWTWV